MTNIKNLFEEYTRNGGEIYLPPMKVELVAGARLWCVSFDLCLQKESKLQRLREIELTTDNLPFYEGLDLILKLNARTYRAKVNMGLGHKHMPADKVIEFCEKYHALQQAFPEDITVVTPENASLYLRAHNQSNQSRYMLADRIKGNIKEIKSHIKGVDALIAAHNLK